MKKIKKIGVITFAKFMALLGAVIGLICGIVYSFGGLLIDVLVSNGFLSAEAMSTPGLSYGSLLAFGALIGMPLIGAAFGFVSGIFGAVFYNKFSKSFGRIEIEIEEKSL